MALMQEKEQADPLVEAFRNNKHIVFRNDAIRELEQRFPRIQPQQIQLAISEARGER